MRYAEKERREVVGRALLLGALLSAAAAPACSDLGTGGPEAAVPAEGGPAAAITTVGYTAVVGDDWKSYADETALRAADYFWWFETGDVYQYVDLMPDATFGQVVRITFPQNSGTLGPAVRLAKTLPAALDKAWYRWRVRFTPGFTTVGPDPAGHANSYKMAFWTWESHNGRGHVEFTNTDQYNLGFGIQDRATGQYLQYTETPLPGSVDFGRVTTEWTDGEWWEYVIYYEKTGPTSANQRYWRRRLTSGGQIVNNPWVFTGWSATGATTPRVAKVELGANKNKNNPTDMYLTWGPWEVVDGSRFANPFNMPGMGTAPAPAPAPTLSRVVVTPDSAAVAAGGTAQFQASGVYSDGSRSAVAATWTATGGTVSASGLYTAGQTAGTYRVIATAGGKADTSTVRVSAAPPPAPTLTRVVVAPERASLRSGGTMQFTASGVYSDGSTAALQPAWTATGGTITSSGLYTAGKSSGTYHVIATSGGQADTALVSIKTFPGRLRTLSDSPLRLD